MRDAAAAAYHAERESFDAISLPAFDLTADFDHAPE
jgi:hypothetical protein